ncbi:hypothetical protein BCR44DRAFT_1423641 [Catenaria anguillulae PL171]|uniref:Serine protease n=1 Tax=Catenaria anguillulae PL171 TaxID=765915 RepID=A0A1Y2I1U0_9FUNG|nr:hypothetical protein BCR44DRAFT_1423641 [Catenaria anguillulae PL171]
MAPHHHASHRRTFSATKIRSLFWFLLVAVLTTPSHNQVEAAPFSMGRRLYDLPKTSTSTLPLSFGRTDIPIPSDPPAQGRPVVWSQTIDIKALQPERKNIIWTRLRFSTTGTKLRIPTEPRTTAGWGANLPGDIVKITNQADQSVQYFNAVTLKQWSFNSAFFNGGKLTLELLADPTLPADQTPSVVVTSVKINSDDSDNTDTISLPPPNSQCNANDERRPSSDTRWTINDPSNSGCQLTAGHCFDDADLTEQVLQFNVPTNIVLRSKHGDRFPVARHPPADQQFAIDVDSDWGYFGVHPNPNTGKRPREQFANQAFDLAPVDPATGLLKDGVVKVGDQATIRGFGAVYDEARMELSQVQQTHTGTVYKLADAYHVDHRADTEGGNSGSPIILANGQALGIHTNGGCRTTSSESANWGSTVAMRGLQTALAAPKGVCKV